MQQRSPYDRVPRANSPYGPASPTGNNAPPRPREEQAYGSGAGQPRPRGGETGYAPFSASSMVTPGADNFSEAAAGGMAGIAYTVAEHNARESGLEAASHTGQLPPPPSRSHQGVSRPALYPQQGTASRSHDRYGAEAGFSGATSSPPRSMNSFPGEQYSRGPSQGSPGVRRSIDPNFGILDPNDIADDGDEGLYYGKNSQRNSVMSGSNSDRDTKAVLGTGTAAAGGAMGKLFGRNAHIESYALDGPEKISEPLAKQKGRTKRWKWIIIGLVFLVVAGATVGGIVGGLVEGSKHGGKASNSASQNQTQSQGQTSNDDGDLGLQSAEIQKLLNNPDLSKVFPGIDYSSYNTQYPACLADPPLQNNVTKDVAVLSQLTNTIRLYGTDCNQTEMVLHAIQKLEMTKDIKIWLGVYLNNNQTTNNRQLDQMYNILETYGQDPFLGVIIGNEVLYGAYMSVDELVSVLNDVRSNLTSKNMDLKVGTSGLAVNLTSSLAKSSDFIMVNVHPFFGGVPASDAASWTYDFFKNQDGQFFKTDSSDNIIAETGWPSAGGTDCGVEGVYTCDSGSVAGIDEMNQFMSDWVCPALENGTSYFWFEAFDEPWKVIYDVPHQHWESKWGLMDTSRNLKPGLKIPDCGGKRVS